MIGLALLLLAQGVPDLGVDEALAQGRHQLAMAAAKGLEPGGREAAEAEVLYQARSYDEALWKVLEALAEGVEPDCTLLSRGVSSAIWVGDVTAGRDLLARLRTAVAALAEGERPAWTSHAGDLEGYLVELEARTAETDAARSRASMTSALVGLGALGLLLFGLRSWRDA